MLLSLRTAAAAVFMLAVSIQSVPTFADQHTLIKSNFPQGKAFPYVLPIPTNVHLTEDASECGKHDHEPSAANATYDCNGSIAGGGQILVWDFDTTDYAVDGYHVYIVRGDGSTRLMTFRHATAPQYQFAEISYPMDISKQIDGCYAVAAFKGGSDLRRSSVVCTK